jgi:hypothetical protein
MNTSRLVACFALALALFAPLAWSEGRVIEQSIEVAVKHVALPASVDGELVVGTCAKCKPRPLRASAATIYLIDREPVTFAQFVEFARRNPSAPLAVMYLERTQTLTRVLAWTAGSDQR